MLCSEFPSPIKKFYGKAPGKFKLLLMSSFLRRMHARLGARALQARMEKMVEPKSLQISCMRACKARAPSLASVFLTNAFSSYIYSYDLLGNWKIN